MSSNTSTNNAVSIFNFYDNDIRVVGLNSGPWFVASDVCRVLGLHNTTQAVRSLAPNERNLMGRSNLNQNEVSFPNRGATVISESGLYKLVLRSDKPQAKDFQDWVTQVVLPAIRKDGAYIKDEEKVASGEMGEEEFILKAYDMLRAKVDRLRAERDAAKEEAKEANFSKDAMKESIGRFNHSVRDTVRMLDPRVSVGQSLPT